MVNTVVDGKVMLNKVLCIPLIMGLICLQASLQTARGGQSDEEISTVYQYIAPQERSDPAIIIPGIMKPLEAGQPMDIKPQARCELRLIYNSTGTNGVFRGFVNNGYLSAIPVCSCLHMDAPHRINSTVIDNVHEIRSWTPSGQQAGPIWFSCLVPLCFY